MRSSAASQNPRFPLGIHMRAILCFRSFHNITIDAVAEMAGFGSAASLRHHFKRQLATTPTAYRGNFGRRLEAAISSGA